MCAKMATLSETGYKVGVVGATGAVGVEMVRCLAHISFPVSELALYASARSAGKTLETEYGPIVIQEFSVEAARSCKFVFLAVSGDFAKEHAKAMGNDGGPFVIDNSSAFRYDDDIPLVIPEINSLVLSKDSKLVANPNCTTAIAAVALYPLHKEFVIKKMVMSTYQAASGAGAEGMDELIEGSKRILDGGDAPANAFAYPLAFNLIPHIDKFQPNGYTKEEMKVTWETLKIFGAKAEDMKISCTAVRVPIKRAHSEAITLETEKPVTPEAARKILSTAAGCRLVDDVECAKPVYPMPMNATSDYDIEVGRVRPTLVFDNGLDLFVSGDQLLRGAAWNAVLIGKELLKFC